MCMGNRGINAGGTLVATQGARGAQSQMGSIRTGVIKLLAMNSVEMNQQCILSKGSFNSNTHHTRLCTNQWMKMCGL